VASALGTDAAGTAVTQSLALQNGEAVTPFSFVQLSDTHVGFQDAPDPLGTKAFEAAVREVNALERQPDLLLVTGDLTHDSEKEGESLARMKRFQEIIGQLKVKKRMYIPGEHDAGLDGGELYRGVFGPTHYTFDHRGIHFIALDNVSAGDPVVGPEQLAWLAKDLARFPRSAPIVVFTHRPLFDLKPEWEWYTGDGDKVLDLLAPYENVTVLYGHIHRHHEQETAGGHVHHFAARSLIFGYPDPATPGDRKPLPFDPKQPFKNLGLRKIQATRKGAGASLGIDDVELTLREYSGTVGINQILKGVDIA
jgi:3',5'-cyclic AMP phosphodiesterase CpdA